MVLVPAKKYVGQDMKHHAALALLSCTCILLAAFLMPPLLQQADQAVGCLCRYGLKM